MYWLERAQKEVVVDCGQISKSDRGRLDRAAKKGMLDKWRGYWYPLPGASYGIGPIKTCFGPVGSKETLP